MSIISLIFFVLFFKYFTICYKQCGVYLSDVNLMLIAWLHSDLFCCHLCPSVSPNLSLNPKTLQNYKTKWNKTLRQLEQFSEQTPFLSDVSSPCCGYFSMLSRESALWLLITCLLVYYLLRHILLSLSFSLYLCQSVSNLPAAGWRRSEGLRNGGGSSKFLPVAQHPNPPPFLPSSGIILQFHWLGGVLLRQNK